MFCSNCGKTLKGDVTACPHCGATVGESRFEGHPYTGAQIRTKPGEAVRLPGNHTKTTFMGKTPVYDQDVDARTTYRATADQVYRYDEPEEIEDIVETEEDFSYDTPEYDEEAYVFDSPEEEKAEEAQPVEEYDESVVDVPDEEEYDDAASVVFDTEETEEYEDEAFEPEADEEIEFGEEYDEEAEYETDYDEELEYDEPKKKKSKEKKLSRRERRIRAEDEMVDAELEELRVREIRIDNDDDFEEGIRKYRESGRYDEVEEEPVVRKNLKIDKKSFKKLFGFKKRVQEEDFESLTPDEFEIADDESAFDLSDVPGEEPEDADVYDEEALGSEFDEEIENELEEELGDIENMELDEAEEAELEEMMFNENRRVLSPRMKNIIKYGAAAVLLVLIVVGAVIGLGRITESTRKAPIDGVTPDLFDEGVQLMKYRAGIEYRNSKTAGFDGTQQKLIAITANLDSVSGMLPENQLVNDQRFVAALSAIQDSINASIMNDLLDNMDQTKTQAQRNADSAQRWQKVTELVDALGKCTSTAQLDAIVKGEKIEIIQQATPEPEPTATPVPYKTLSKGSKNDDVRALQTRLSELGYLDGAVDGDFGNKTKTAVQLFQKKVGMEATGIADVAMQTALFSPDAPRK